MPSSTSFASLDIPAALDDIAAFRTRRLRLVVAIGLLSLVAVAFGSWHISYEIIGGDQATIALLPTFAFLAGIAVLITALAFLLGVRTPIHRRFQQLILGPIFQALFDDHRDESRRQLQRELWENSQLFDDGASQRTNNYFQACRLDDLTIGWCQLRLDRPLRGSEDERFDGCFMVATADDCFSDAIRPLFGPGDEKPDWLADLQQGPPGCDDVAISCGDGALYLALNTPVPTPATHPRDDDPTAEDFQTFMECQRFALTILQKAHRRALA